MGQLDGKVAWVTGAGTGIGEAGAKALAREGASVVLSGRRREPLEAVARAIETAGGRAVVEPGDMTDAKRVTEIAESIRERFGRLDILVNNAGITSDKQVVSLTDEDWNRVLAVNLSGAFFTSQAALPHMLERGSGRIVNISSVIGETGNIGQVNYASAKSGLFGLTKTLAREACFQLQRSGKLGDGIGLTVNTVTPGYISTEMVQAVPEKVLASITAKIPMGRLGRPEEVARIVHFLAADASGYITGQVWGVNGGLDM